MTSKLKRTITQMVLIVGGLAAFYFLFSFLFAVLPVLAWILFAAILLLLEEMFGPAVLLRLYALIRGKK